MKELNPTIRNGIFTLLNAAENRQDPTAWKAVEISPTIGDIPKDNI